MVLVTKDTIGTNQPIILKWAESPYNTAANAPESRYAFNPGWSQPSQVDDFYIRMEESTSIIKDATFIKMDRLQHNFEYLRTELKADDVRYVQTLDNANLVGRQIQDIYQFDESTPEFRRNSLDAHNIVAYTLIPETFLKENIEKENFLPTMEEQLGMKMGMECERIGMYGIADSTRPHGRSAMDTVDGIFSQLSKINQTAITGTDDPQGFGSPINTKGANVSVVGQLQDKLNEFIAQNGRDEYAQFYVSRMLYNKILKEASHRETNKGDAVYFNGSEVTIFGTKIKRVDFLNPLNDPLKRNGWGHLALLCDPASLVWGFFNEIESKSTYEHEKLSYLTSLQCAFDTTMIWEEDVLAFAVNDYGSGKLTATIIDNAKQPLAGITVDIYEPDGTTALYTGTTVAGVAEITGIPYGKYVAKLSGTGYATQEKDIVINSAEENLKATMKAA